MKNITHKTIQEANFISFLDGLISKKQNILLYEFFNFISLNLNKALDLNNIYKTNDSMISISFQLSDIINNTNLDEKILNSAIFKKINIMKDSIQVFNLNTIINDDKIVILIDKISIELIQKITYLLSIKDMEVLAKLKQPKSRILFPLLILHKKNNTTFIATIDELQKIFNSKSNCRENTFIILKRFLAKMKDLNKEIIYEPSFVKMENINKPVISAVKLSFK